ncbi:MAG: hypothetical protein ACJ8HQ_11050, partial [Chthoniobacterales bacterium]
MNDFSELEAELKQLRPRAASPELMSRVKRALEEPNTATASGGILPRRKASLNWFALGFGLAAAAALLMLARVSTDRPKATQPVVASTITTPVPRAAVTNESSYVPDGITRVVYNTRNEGLVFASNSNQPMRR